jgi:hypothetical protein
MWLDAESETAAELFWQLAGEPEVFPRSLERSLALALPVALVKLPRLRLSGIESWLRRRGTTFVFGCESRAVRGCLVAHAGKGLLFVDGADPDDERRFTLAHEIAHYLVDYWLPRQKAIERLGPELADVVDGLRAPTLSERVHAMLGSIRVGPYQSLMERADQAELSDIWNAENRADRLALALLAPPGEVLPRANLAGGTFEERLQAMAELLTTTFGLPGTVARGYGRGLLRAAGKGPSWVEALGVP